MFVPGFMEDIGVLEQHFLARPEEDHEPERQELASRLAQKVKELVLWRFQWERDHPQLVSERPVSTIASAFQDIARPEEFETVFWFGDISYANEISLYNNLLAQLLYIGVRAFEPRLLQKVMQTIPASDIPVATNPLLLPYGGLRLGESLSEMCRLVDYFLIVGPISDESLSILGCLRLW